MRPSYCRIVLLLSWMLSAVALKLPLSRSALVKGGLALAAAPLTQQPAIADEPLKGAKAFIGSWKFEASKGPTGELIFKRNGEVELRHGTEQQVIGIGAVPWQYVAPKGSDTMVSLSFTLDCESERNVLIYQGTVNSAGGPQRQMEGSVETGRAEIGARGGDYGRKRVGSFTAVPVL